MQHVLLLAAQPACEHAILQCRHCRGHFRGAVQEEYEEQVQELARLRWARALKAAAAARATAVQVP